MVDTEILRVTAGKIEALPFGRASSGGQRVLCESVAHSQVVR